MSVQKTETTMRLTIILLVACAAALFPEQGFAQANRYSTTTTNENLFAPKDFLPEAAARTNPAATGSAVTGSATTRVTVPARGGAVRRSSTVRNPAAVSPPATTSQNVASQTTKLLRKMMTRPGSSQITGRAISLAEALQGAANRQVQSQRVEAYWQLCSSLTDYYLGLQEMADLRKLYGAEQTPNQAAWELALQKLSARTKTAELAAFASQYRLKSLIFPNGTMLPLPVSFPHAGTYTTLYKENFSNLQNQEAATLNQLIKSRHQELVNAANAVTEAENFIPVVARTAEQSNGGVGVIKVHSLVALQRRAFIQICLDYNRRIARYTELVAPQKVNTQQLVGMLIKTKSSRLGWSDSSRLEPTNTKNDRLAAVSKDSTFAGNNRWKNPTDHSVLAVKKDPLVVPANLIEPITTNINEVNQLRKKPLFVETLPEPIAVSSSTETWVTAKKVPLKPAVLKIGYENVYPNFRIELPLMLTHAGDGSGQKYVVAQKGVIYRMPENRQAKKAETFLDIRDRVRYQESQNEEGLLGLAFHPNFKKNRELYVYYSAKFKGESNKGNNKGIIARFKTFKEDPNKVDPASEEIILTIKQPYWNHNGGTILFGPQGYLYIGLGDGGYGKDPHGNGQNKKTLLGSILRIDVNRSEEGKAYGIPADNPFADKKDGTRREIWAYGIRNIWRMAFDKKTGVLWAADVGQDKWEEINLITKGGNYGWNRREGIHPFKPKEGEKPAEMIDPIYEYDHTVGASITGGFVYRGKKVPALFGKYLYGDYVSGKMWALKYDHEKKEVISNEEIDCGSIPLMSFGQDAEGEAYFLSRFGDVFRLTAEPNQPEEN